MRPRALGMQIGYRVMVSCNESSSRAVAYHCEIAVLSTGRHACGAGCSENVVQKSHEVSRIATVT